MCCGFTSRRLGTRLQELLFQFFHVSCFIRRGANLSWCGKSHKGRSPVGCCWSTPMLSLTTTRGPLLWSGLRSLWNLRCAATYQNQQLVMDKFIVGWIIILRRWRA